MILKWRKTKRRGHNYPSDGGNQWKEETQKKESEQTGGIYHGFEKWDCDKVKFWSHCMR